MCGIGSLSVIPVGHRHLVNEYRCAAWTGVQVLGEAAKLKFRRIEEVPEYWKDQQCVHLIAKWSPLGLDLFHKEAWGTPETHLSAAADILAGAQCLTLA